MESLGLGHHGNVYSPYGFSLHAETLFLGFNGGWVDTCMSAYALGNGHRFYQPRLSRFISADSSSPFGEGGINAYCYCLGDPINRHDPSGRASALWTRAMDAFRRSRIQRFPNELLEHVAKQLPGPDLAAFSQSSKRLKGVVSPLLEKSQDRFWRKLLNEPDTQDKMVFALKVSYGLEKDIHPGAASRLGITRPQMDDLILESNRNYYQPQVAAITARQANEAANRAALLRQALLQHGPIGGIR